MTLSKSVLALIVIGAMYGIWRPSKLMPIVSGTLRESTMLRELVRPEVLDVVANAPGEHWRISWPLANLAIWGETLATKATGFVEAAADAGVPAVPYLGAAEAA